MTSLDKMAVSALAFAAMAGAANAATLITPSGNLSEQVHANGAQSGFTVTGHSQPGGYYIDFTSAQTLTTTGNGVAQVNGPFDWVTISPSATTPTVTGFEAIQFSVPDHNNTPGGKQVNSAGDSFTVIADFVGGGSQTFNPTVVSNNKYEVLAGVGQVIADIQIGGLTDPKNGSLQIGDVRQVYFDAATVPEPATWAAMLVGLLGLGVVLRSRRSAAHIA